MPDFDSAQSRHQELVDDSDNLVDGEFVPHRDNPQRVLAVSLINTLGFKEALRFARERQWQGVIVQIYRGLQSGPT